MEIMINTTLNITSEDVEKEKEIKILQEWKNILYFKSKEINARLETVKINYSKENTEENKSKYIRTSDAKTHNSKFLNIIEDRIRILKKKNGQNMSKYIQNLVNFKDIAKQLLAEDLYEEINVKAKLKTEEIENN